MSFLAVYEDAHKVEVSAKLAGFTGEDGESWFDFVEDGYTKHNTARGFPSLPLAVAWVKKAVLGNKTVYGSGHVYELQVVKRCHHCTCDGVHRVREYLVDDEGIAENNSLPSPCLDD